MSNRRTSRLNDQLREELSDLIRLQVRDPRLAEIVSITEVAISADMRTAKVFVSTFGEEVEKRQTLKGLSAAAGFLRRGLRARLSLKEVPALTFVRDDSIEEGAHLLALMKEVAPPPEADP